jgi:homoaconitase/3-isopropylmalate dehydratase large subunit
MYKSHSLYFEPDHDAVYAAVFEINLNEVESFIAIYPSPDQVFPVTECLRMKVDGCFIGACTTTEEDLVLAALVLEAGLKRGLVLADGKRVVVPGSLPIVRNLRKLGLWDIYSRCGYERPAPGCSLCLGIGADVAAAGSHWLSSQNRNFQNRMGKGKQFCTPSPLLSLLPSSTLLARWLITRFQVPLATSARLQPWLPLRSA